MELLGAPMELLAEVCHVESRFGPVEDSIFTKINLDAPDRIPR